MPDWTKENPSCVMTWVTLLLLGQYRKAFPDGGVVPMNRLQFWAGSAEGRAARAKALGVQMIHTLRDMFGAKYEPQRSFSTALIAMVDVLMQEEKTVADLAATDNEQFLFLEERQAEG